MRQPKATPKLDGLIAGIPPKRFSALLPHARATDEKGRYLHWDELVHRKAPDGFSHEEHWAAIKLVRSMQAQRLPLLGSGGEAFMFCETPDMRSRLHMLDGEARGQLKTDEPVITRETADYYIVRSLIEEPYSSSVLEGAGTTRRVAKEMIESNREPRTIDERMILNNYRAMRLIREMKESPLTPEAVLQLHAALTQGTLEDPKDVGNFRSSSDSVVVEDRATGEVLHNPPPANELPERLRRLCAFANQRNDGDAFIHPLVRAMILHFMIGFDHPFVDGNGRTARALFYWSALRSGYWFLEFASISKAIREAPTRYGMAYLHSETDHGDLTYFLIYHLEILAKALRSLQTYIDRKTAELQILEKAVRAKVGARRRYNERQVNLLQEAIRRPGHRMTIDGHRARSNVSYLTARADLEGLVKLGLLRKGTAGKQSIYYADEKIVEKLGAS